MAGGNGSFDLNHLVLAGCARGDLDFALWILLGCLQQLLPLLRLSHESLIHCAEQAYVKALAVQVHFALEFHTVWPARDPFRESMIPFATIQLCNVRSLPGTTQIAYSHQRLRTCKCASACRESPQQAGTITQHQSCNANMHGGSD
jgi:hypothetical protein